MPVTVLARRAGCVFDVCTKTGVFDVQQRPSAHQCIKSLCNLPSKPDTSTGSAPAQGGFPFSLFPSSPFSWFLGNVMWSNE